jgi:Fic family protein
VASACGLKLSLPTVGKSLEHLVELGIVREVTGKQRRRAFAYRKYLDVLDRGTEPLPR